MPLETFSLDRRRERHALLRQRVQTRLVFGMFVILATAALIELRSLLVPIALAAMLTILLHPLVHVLTSRFRLPLVLSAGVVLFLLLGAMLVAGLGLAPAILLWMEKLPDQLRNAEFELRDLSRPVEAFKETTSKLEAMAGLGAEQTPTVVERETNLAAVLLAHTQSFIVQAGLTIGLLFFFLAFGDAFLRRIVQALPRRSSRVRALLVIDSVRRDVGRYIATVSLINIGLGVTVAVVLWLLKIPNALLWGVMAGVLNFVPYIGAIAGVIIITMVALATYSDIAPALGVGGIYYGISVIEGTFVTPAILGKRLQVNPIVVFVGLLFWGWVWGIAGAVIAVPLLVGMKIVADHVRSLEGLGVAMGSDEADEAAIANGSGPAGRSRKTERPGTDA